MTAPPSANRGGAAQIWDQYCSSLAAVGKRMLDDENVRSEREQAETLRYLTRELRISLEGAFETASPDFPQFLRTDETSSGPTAPNLDNWYMTAQLRGDAVYVLRGNVESVFEVNISVHDAGMRNVLSEAFKADLATDGDGTFELVLGPDEESVGVRLAPEAAVLMIRVYFYDWDHETPPWFQLTCRTSEGSAPAAVDLQRVEGALDQSVTSLERRLGGWTTFLLGLLREAPVNTLRAPDFLPGGGKLIRYGGGIHEIAPDEALVIEVEPPDARYWMFQLYSIPWWEPIDVANRVTSLNGRQVSIDADGTARIVVAHRDPGVQNWLDAAGATQGAVFYRWIWSNDAPVPASRVVALTDVRDHLHPGTPAFGTDERVDQLARRRAHLARRFRH